MDAGNCGPSNPSKGLSRHLTQDRGLQQDRVIAGPSGGQQAFRSAVAQQTAGAQDFTNFQAGNAGFPDAHYLPVAHIARGQPGPGWSAHTPPIINTPQASWTAEFQRLNLNNGHGLHGHTAAPTRAHGPIPSAPVQRGQTGMFGGGSSHTPQMPIHQGLHGMQHPGYMGRGYMGAPHTQLSPAILGGPVDFSDPYYHDPSYQYPGYGSGALSSLDQEFQQEMDKWVHQNHSYYEPATQPREDTTTDINHQQEPEESSSARHQDDELAQAAQGVLNSTSDNKTEKFKNSAFLSMMQKLASHDAVVRGNEIIEANEATTQPQRSSPKMSPKMSPKIDRKGKGKAKAVVEEEEEDDDDEHNA